MKSMNRMRSAFFGGLFGVAVAVPAALAGENEQYLGANAAECEIEAALTGEGLKGKDARYCGAPAGKLKVGVTRGLTFGKKVGGKKSEGPIAVAFPIQFESGSAALTADAKKLLDKIGASLAKNADKRFVIEGHADAVGGADANMSLSRARAASVRSYLVTAHGIEGERLDAVGRGETDPIDPADPNAAINRRVVLVNVGS